MTAERAGVPACPLCGGADLVPWCAGVARLGARYEVRLCTACDLGVTVPAPDAAALERLHASAAYRPHGVRFVRPVEWLRGRFAAGRVSLLERFATAGRLLDVGCGGGAFLLAARGRGWEVHGAELTPETARLAREAQGLDVRTGAPDGWGFDEASFDAVTLWHVLEHVPDPAGMVAQCARLLRPGGVTVVSVPNLRSVQAALAGRHWFHLDVPYHAVHFSPRSLGSLLRAEGFDVLEVGHWCAEHGPFGVLQSLLNRMGIERNALFERLKGGGGEPERRTPGAGLAASAALLPVLGPVSAALALGEAALRRGGVITICARRRSP